MVIMQTFGRFVWIEKKSILILAVRILSVWSNYKDIEYFMNYLYKLKILFLSFKVLY